MPPTPTLERALRDGRSRLYPSISDPNWPVLRERRKIFEAGKEDVA